MQSSYFILHTMTIQKTTDRIFTVLKIGDIFKMNFGKFLTFRILPGDGVGKNINMFVWKKLRTYIVRTRMIAVCRSDAHKQETHFYKAKLLPLCERTFFAYSNNGLLVFRNFVYLAIRTTIFPRKTGSLFIYDELYFSNIIFLMSKGSLGLRVIRWL